MSDMKRVIEHIASISFAIEGCKERMAGPLAGHTERWYRRHVGALCSVLKDTLPSGSGFDDGVTLNHDLTSISDERFVFDTPFSCMNENGFYTNWTEFRVTVTPSFLGMNLEIERTGGPVDDEDSLADYICEAMQEALSAQYVIPAVFYSDM